MTVSIVIPAYNEAKIIKNNLEAINHFMQKNYYDYEIIVVDDGSTDGTSFVAAGVEKVKVIATPTNKGKGNAVKQGVKVAEGDYIIFTDADLAYDPEYFKPILESLELGMDVVIGSRYTKQAPCKYQSFLRRMMSESFIWLANKILDLRVSDVQCGIKGFKNSIAKILFARQTIDGFGFDVELISNATRSGYIICEVPVFMKPSTATKVNVINDTFKMFINIITIRRNQHAKKH
ncbi:MAG: glycosyltransferase [Clostridiales bacterium]|jgi:dolichyl-phosphate beta-glucosyltransferase|nr:glycosyltransferase [Clostridiales bacterium]